MRMHSLAFLFGIAIGARPALCEEWVIGSVAPLGSIWAASLQSMLTCVLPTIPNGRLVAGGALGDELEIGRKLSQNQIAVASGSAGSWASRVPELGALELPEIFKNDLEVDQTLFQNPMRQKIEKLAEPRGLHLLMVVENGFREVISFKNPIISPADLVGLSFRVQQNRIYEDLFQALKTLPKMLPVTAVPAAISNGALDAADQTLLYAASAHWLKFAKSITMTNHTYQVAFVFASTDWWKSLSDSQRTALDHCSVKAQESGRDSIRTESSKVIANLKQQGMRFEVPNQKLKDAFHKAAQITHDLYKSRSKQSELDFLKDLGGSVAIH